MHSIVFIETKSKKASDHIISPSVMLSFCASDNRDKRNGNILTKPCKVVLSRSELTKTPSNCIQPEVDFSNNDVNDNRDKHEEKILTKPCKAVLSRFKLPSSLSDCNQSKVVLASCEVNDNAYLRRSQRKIPVKIAVQIKENNKTISNLITPTQMTNILWRSMVVKGWDIEVGMLVCAKMSTYWPWPAQVTGIFRKKVRVTFFGDLREGSVDITCVPFYNCQAIVLNYVNIIDEKTKNSFKQNVIDNIEKPRNNFHKKVSLKHLYLQAIRDLELYAGKEESFILSIL